MIDTARCMPRIVFNVTIAFAGLLITAYSKNSGAYYFGIFLCVGGCSANLPMIIAFQSNNVRSALKAVSQKVYSFFSQLLVDYMPVQHLYRRGIFLCDWYLMRSCHIVSSVYFMRGYVPAVQKNRAADEIAGQLKKMGASSILNGVTANGTVKTLYHHKTAHCFLLTRAGTSLTCNSPNCAAISRSPCRPSDSAFG